MGQTQQPDASDAASDSGGTDTTASDTAPSGDQPASEQGTDDVTVDDETPLAVTIQADTLAEFLAYPQALVEEARIHVSETGFELTMVDPANVGSIQQTLGTGAFERFAHDGPDTLGVNLDRLAEVVGMADDDDLVRAELDGETRKLHLKAGALEFTLGLIDPDTIRAEPEMPDLDLSATVQVAGRDLQRAMTAADMVSDHVALGVDGAGTAFTVDADGDTDDVHLELTAEDCERLTTDADGGVESLYSLDYVADLASLLDADQVATIRLGDEQPIRLQLSYADGAGQVVYMIAPRISTN